MKGLRAQGAFNRIMLNAVLISIFADACKIQALIPILKAIMFQKIMLVIPIIGLFMNTQLLTNIKKSFSSLRGKALIFLVVWMVVSVPFSVYPGHSFMFLTDHLWKMLVSLCILIAYGDTKESLNKMIWAFFLAVGVFGVIAFISSHTGRFSVVSAYDPNENALLFVMAIPFVFWQMMSLRGLKKIALGCLLGLLVLGIVETQSRGGFLGLVAVTLVSVYQYKRATKAAVINIKIVASIALILGVLYFAGGQQYSNRISSIFNTENNYNYTATSGRLTIWRQGFQLMLDNPFLGVGIDSFESALGRTFRMDQGQWQSAHNSFLQVGTELGFPGLIAFCFIIISSIAYLKKAAKAQVAPMTAAVEDSSGGVKQKLNLISIMAYSLIGSWTGYIVSGTFLSVAYGNLIFFLLGTSWAFINVASVPQEREEPVQPEKAVASETPAVRKANMARAALKRYGTYR
jgi:O-antigen ligase